MSYITEIKKIYKAEGLKGFTRGYTGILLRDCPGFAMYFTLFDLFKRVLGVPNHQDHDHPFLSDVTFKKFVSGGSAGCFTWFFAYPFDTVKS